MRVVLVCGDRNWGDFKKIFYELEKEHAENPITYLVEGGADGADTLALNAAKRLGIQPVECPALWEKYGMMAGPIRNKKQLVVATTLAGFPELGWEKNLSVLAFHSNIKESKGTANMVRQARTFGAKVRIIK